MLVMSQASLNYRRANHVKHLQSDNTYDTPDQNSKILEIVKLVSVDKQIQSGNFIIPSSESSQIMSDYSEC